MGYYIQFRGADIHIPKENIRPALDAIAKRAAKGFNSVDAGDILKACANGRLEDVFEEFGFDASFMDDEFEVDGYHGEKYYSELGLLFEMLAPFVADGSYAEFDGEDTENIFRYLMTGGKCYEQSAEVKLTWPEPRSGDLYKN